MNMLVNCCVFNLGHRLRLAGAGGKRVATGSVANTWGSTSITYYMEFRWSPASGGCSYFSNSHDPPAVGLRIWSLWVMLGCAGRLSQRVIMCDGG